MSQLYTMPVPPSDTHPDHAYHQAFVHAMNRLPRTMAMAEKLPLAIDQTAQKMQTSPAHIARVLVEYGLRAPRHAFPSSFIDFIDRCPTPRLALDRAVLGNDVVALKEFWQHGAAVPVPPMHERIRETA